MSVNTPRRKPVQDYFKLQGRFRHLSEKEIQLIQERVDKDYNTLVERAEKDTTG
jgi:pyruvate ferredoxin oxidoreductase beta subunit